MTQKTLPFSKHQIETIRTAHPTPFYIYDERGIRAGARELLRAFAWAEGFKEYFAVKATPNPYILKILRAEGLGADCSSAPELQLAERAGMRGEEIMFSSNDTPASEFRAARALGALINLDDLSHLAYLEQHAGLPGASGDSQRARPAGANDRTRCAPARLQAGHRTGHLAPRRH